MMTREEYERQKQRLEAQLAEGIELLRAGFPQQIRALEMVWMTTAAEDVALSAIPAAETSLREAASVGTSAPPQPAKPARRPRQKAGQLSDDVDAALDRVPQVFDRSDLLKALGYEPERSSLHRVVQELVRAGVIAVHTSPAGKIATKYEKVEAESP